MRVLVVVPTFEPRFERNEGTEAYYRRNFDAWLQVDDAEPPFLVLSDFKSSDPYRAFLRDYVDAHPGRVALLEGEQALGSFQAFNMAAQRFDYDVAVWAASDTRPRDGAWLGHMLADFSDPDVVASIPTATEDGAACLAQTQPAPLDRASTPIALPNFFQLVVGCFRRRMLEAFDDRLCDRLKDMGNEKGMMWQIEAVGGRAVLNYRFNVIHERYYEEGRYNWKADSHVFRRDRTAENTLSRAFGAFLSAPGGWGYYQPPLLEDLAKGWREKGLRGLARELYIRWRRNPLFYIRKMMRMPYHNFLFEKLVVSHQLAGFRALDEATRIRMVDALYMGPPEVYRTVSATHYAPAGAAEK